MFTAILILMVVAVTNEIIPSSSAGGPDHMGGPTCTVRDTEYPRDCTDAYTHCEGDVTESEVIWIQPEDAPEPFKVYCNNSIDGGGWTVFQRRVDGSVEFYNNWAAYKHGFGFLEREFWLGNDKLSYLTNQANYELRIDFVNREGSPYFAKYDLFRVSNELSRYRLVDLGKHLPESTAKSNALASHKNMTFSTNDRDYDQSGANCASKYHGAWWYNACHASNLNGHYFAAVDRYDSIRWANLPGSQFNIKYTDMKVRRL